MDVKLKRVGHIALAINDGQLLLVWGGYMVSFINDIQLVSLQ